MQRIRLKHFFLFILIAALNGQVAVAQQERQDVLLESTSNESRVSARKNRTAKNQEIVRSRRSVNTIQQGGNNLGPVNVTTGNTVEGSILAKRNSDVSIGNTLIGGGNTSNVHNSQGKETEHRPDLLKETNLPIQNPDAVQDPKTRQLLSVFGDIKDQFLKLNHIGAAHYEELMESIDQVAAEEGLSEEQKKLLISLSLDFTPYVGSGKSLAQVFTGRDTITDEELSRLAEGAGILLGFLPAGKALLKTKKKDEFLEAYQQTKKLSKLVIVNNKVGKHAEKLLQERLAKTYGKLDTTDFYNSVTPKGKRYYDLVTGTGDIAIESKVGYVKNNERIRTQILKDIDAIRRGQKESIDWISTKSPITEKQGFDPKLKEFTHQTLEKYNLPKDVIRFVENSPITTDDFYELADDINKSVNS